MKMMRKNMTDREILQKHINLDDSCLMESEKTQVRDMIYEYREAFSLKDEIWNKPKHRDRHRCHRQNTILY